MRTESEDNFLEVVYDDEVDILTIDVANREGDEYKESIPVGNYIIDIDEEGKILGIEILDFSETSFSKEQAKDLVRGFE